MMSYPAEATWQAARAEECVVSSVRPNCVTQGAILAPTQEEIVLPRRRQGNCGYGLLSGSRDDSAVPWAGRSAANSPV